MENRKASQDRLRTSTPQVDVLKEQKTTPGATAVRQKEESDATGDGLTQTGWLKIGETAPALSAFCMLDMSVK